MSVVLSNHTLNLAYERVIDNANSDVWEVMRFWPNYKKRGLFKLRHHFN